MKDHEVVETKAMELYDSWNWATGIPWVRRPEHLKDDYRRIARDQLINSGCIEVEIQA